MSRFKSSVIGVATVAALLVSVPAFAQTATGTGTATTTGSTTKAHPDLTCGKIVELNADHAVLQTANKGNVRIALGDKTRFVARSFAAAHDGLKEGDYARAAGGDAQDGAAASLLYGEADFCGESRGGQKVREQGTVSAYTQNTVSVTDSSGDTIIWKFDTRTKFYFNGHLIQAPNFVKGEWIAVAGVHQVDTNAPTNTAPSDEPDYLALVVRLRGKAK